MRIVITTAAVAGLTATCAAACSSSSNGGGTKAAASIGTTMQQVCAAGAKEGSVNIARGTDADVFAKEIVPFEKEYPKIKVHFTSVKPGDNVQRILAEVQAGHSLDVDGTDFDIPSAQPLFQAKQIANVNWTGLGVPADEQLSYDGVTLARTDALLEGLVYDTTKTNPADLPSTWEELASPKWKGKFVVDTRGKELSPISLVWGEQKTITWYKKLMAEAKPVAIEGATASLEKVTSGEVLFSTSAHNAEQAQANSTGAKLGIKYLDVVPAQTDYALILAKSPHPNAIRCLYGWRLSAEGQAQIFKYEFKTNDERPADLPATSKFASDTTAAQGALDSKVQDQFATLTTK
jgi:iron(III) transport system substrate-binding protein